MVIKGQNMRERKNLLYLKRKEKNINTLRFVEIVFYHVFNPYLEILITFKILQSF